MSNFHNSNNNRPKEELIVSDCFEFNNRWLFSNEIIDYAAVQSWCGLGLLQMKNLNLKRVKIFLKNCEDHVTALLDSLNGSESLRQLEIGTLIVREGKRMKYTFKALTSLSIDSVRVVPLFKQFAKERKNLPRPPKIEFDADHIKAVNFGSDSIEYIMLSNLQEVWHLVIDQDPKKKLLKFRALRTLICNQVSQIPLDVIMKFVRGQVGVISELHCNVQKLISAGGRPDAKNLQAFEALFQMLKSCETIARQTKKIYLQGVRMRNFDGDFECYHFEDALIDMHYHNFTENRLVLSPCHWVTSIDFMRDALTTMSSSCCKFGDDLLDPATGLRQARCVNYSNLYPNLQTVHLDNQPSSDGERDLLVEDDLFEFLSTDCKALTKLSICCAGFGSAFYRRIRQLQSVQTLVVFHLVEETDRFRVRFDFDFLQSFRQLRKLYTNLATKPVMIRLVQRMHVSASFVFRFYKLPESDLIVKIDRKSLTQLALNISGSVGKGFVPEKGTIDFQHAATYFNSRAHFSHWLDDLPPEAAA